MKKISHHAPQKPPRPAPEQWQIICRPKQITLKNGGQTLKFPCQEGLKWELQYLWSPDGKAVVVWENTKHPLHQVHHRLTSPKDQVQPRHYTRTYSKPGDRLNVARPVILFTDGRDPIRFKKEFAPHPYHIKNPRWLGPRLIVEFISRGFQEFSLIEINTESKQQRILVREADEKFVHVYGNCFRYDLANEKEMLWFSRRTGYTQLYLVSLENGETIRRLTGGTSVVREVVNLDEKKREVIVTLSGHYPDQDPYYLHYARIHLDTGKTTLLTESNGTHKLHFSPNSKHYVAEWSRVDQPPAFELRETATGKKLATLPSLDPAKLKTTAFPLPQPFVAKDRNGKHDIHGIIIRPSHFDPGKKYPVIESIYAGPHGSFVPKAWKNWHGHLQEMAEAGFIVVKIDGLGTNHRGRDFHMMAYKNLMDSGFPDRIKWIQEAAKKHPGMDLSKVGIYGGSAGGQSTLSALLHHGDFYKVGVADCGCHDNRMDKIWWNEQWMGYPVDQSYVKIPTSPMPTNFKGSSC